MRKAAWCAVLVAVYALVAPAALTMRADASSPTLTLIGASSGAIGTSVTYQYSWDGADCSAGVVAGDIVILVWQNPLTNDPIDQTNVVIGVNCTGTLRGSVPGDATAGDHDVSTAYIQNASFPVAGSEATANRAFLVTTAPSPTPKPTSRATPTPRLTPSPTSPAQRHVAPSRDPKTSPQATAGARQSAHAGAGGPSSRAAVITATSPTPGGPGLLATIPGGLFGLGLFTGVGLVATAVMAFLTVERRRFARMYPREGSRRRR
jgi:hypothetical protein